MTGNIAVADKFLSFLPHSTARAGGPVAVDASSMNPGFLTPTGVTRDDPLQKIVNRRVLEDGVARPKNPEFRNLRFALVDLTGADKIASPKFAGHRETEQGGLGSLAKTACMFALFQLKFDLEELARVKGLKTEATLFQAARDAWDDTQKPDPANVTSLNPSGPKIEQSGKLILINGKQVALPRGLAAPDLERIFTVAPDPAGGGGVTVRFKGDDLILVDPAALRGISPPPTPPPHMSTGVADFLLRNKEKLAEARKLTFAERLFLMIDESDNAACHSIIENVSFLYIASALWQSDIYSPSRGGGLWEASTHDDPKPVRWIFPPVPRPGKGVDFVSATTASVAALFTLLAQNRLVNAGACEGMKHLLSKKKRLPDGRGSLTKSFFRTGLRKANLAFDNVFSKLGIGNFLNDGAIIERTVVPDPNNPAARTLIRYVAVACDDPTIEGDHIHKLIVELDKCIQENNGLITASAP